ISSDEHEWNGEQIVFVARQGSVKNLRTGKEAQPRFLGDPLISRRAGEAEKANEPGSNPSQAGERARARPHDVPPSAGDRRGSPPDELEALANSLTNTTNECLARVQANRGMYQLIGADLLEPP